MATNGLRTFSLHTLDETAQPAVEALRAERPSLAGFAVAEEVGLDHLDPETAARQHLQQALASEALPGLEAPEVNGTESDFKSLGTESLPLTGTRTVKFRQRCQKIPVYGSLVTVELDSGNELLAINSSLGNPTNVDPVARVSPGEALEIAQRAAGPGAQFRDVTPWLFFYFDDSVNRWRLAYILEDVLVTSRQANTAEEHSSLLMDYVIDAHSGELVAELPRMSSVTSMSREGGENQPTAAIFSTLVPGPGEEETQDALGRLRRIRFVADGAGNRILRDSVLNVVTFDFRFRDLDTSSLPGNAVMNPPPPWFDAAVSAHANAAEVAVFLRNRLARNGIDNQGSLLVSSVNCILARESPDGREWRNAAWFRNQMVYGQRSVGGVLRSYAVGLDIVAHEIFHGVTNFSARLE